jgi:hypothetical protein
MMVLQLSSEQVWKELAHELFAVVGMVTPTREARTAGVLYAVHNHRLYVVSGKDTWKVRHIAQNPHVSMTVTIAKSIPLLPWIKIPAATITFSGLACIYPARQMPQEILRSLLRGLDMNAEALDAMCIIEIEPVGDFVTYGVGVSLMTMRHPDMARGRAPVTAAT